MTLGLTLRSSLTDRLQLLPSRLGKLYEIMDFWGHATKLNAQFNVGQDEKKFNYVLAPKAFLDYVADSGNEPFGAYIADMMFVNEDLQRTHPDWIPYVALKLFLERGIDPGRDTSGKVEHWQSLFGTIRVAGMVMNEQQMIEFLAAIKDHDSTQYFDLDKEAKDFFERYKNLTPLEAKRKYLDSHHNNFWVTRGRLDSELKSLAPEISFRNVAETIYFEFGKNLLIHDLYNTSCFVREMIASPAGEPIEVSSPFNHIAYHFTKEANNVSDLVTFVEQEEPIRNGDIIIKESGKQASWVALGKRLSYQISCTERATRQLVEAEKTKLDGIVAVAQYAESRFASSIEQTKALIQTPGSLQEAKDRLLRLRGDYSNQVAAISDLTNQVTTNLDNLEELSDFLLQAI